MRSRFVFALLALTLASIAPLAGDAQPDNEPASAQPAAADPPAMSAAERRAWLSSHIDGLIAARQADLAQARVGALITDVATGEILYQRDPDQRFNLASNTKVITAAAALAILGPNFRARTSLLAEQIDDNGVIPGDLYVRGRGDPGLGRADLAALADHLVRAGITGVRGRVIIDDTYFDTEVTPPHFDEQPDEQASFRAPVSALSLGFNAFAVVVRPARSGTGLATVTIEPPSRYIEIEQNQLITQPSGRNRVRLTSKVERDRILISITGQIRKTTPVRRYRRRIASPLRFVGESFATMLDQRGIAVRRRGIKRGKTPPEARVLASRDSEPVAVLVRGLGKFSNNFVAEMLLKMIGAETLTDDRPATWNDGLSRVRTFLQRDIGVEAGSYRYDNGSGLFDSSEMSPSQLVAVLRAGYRDGRYSADLVGSLAIAGVDGTLRRRMQDTPAMGYIRAKTGTLNAVSTLAGYALRDGLRPLAFAVLVNDLPPEGKANRLGKQAARSLQDEIAAGLVSYLDGGPAADPTAAQEP